LRARLHSPLVTGRVLLELGELHGTGCGWRPAAPCIALAVTAGKTGIAEAFRDIVGNRTDGFIYFHNARLRAFAADALIEIKPNFVKAR
jgi:hypothetical protein